MIKFTRGWIRNDEGVTKDIVVKALLPNKAKDILIGAVLIGLGVTHLTISAFKNGAEHYEEAELKTLDDLGLLK